MRSTVLTLLLAFFTGAIHGQSLNPVSLEQLVNTDIPPNQFQPRVAAAPDGSYVVVWITGQSYGVLKARRYDSSHTAVSGEITIASMAYEHLNIAYWKNGKYVISYLDGSTLKFQVLDELNAVGAAVTVTTTAAYFKQDFAINGDNLAVLYSNTSDRQLYLRGYNLATGTWINSAVLVTEQSGLSYSYVEAPNIIYHPSGRLTAIYHQTITTGCCSVQNKIMRKTFNSSFIAEIPETAIWAPTSSNYVGADMDASGNNNGEVIIATTHGEYPGTDKMRLWILSSTGTFLVNNNIILTGADYSWMEGTDAQLFDNGDYLVTKSFWINLPNGTAPTPDYQDVFVIYGKNYDQSRTAAIKINNTTSGEQDQPAAAKLPNGGFVVAWTGNGFQGDSRGIYSRPYNAPSFPGVVFSNAGTYSVSESGTTATIGIALSAQPSGNVTVDLTSSDLTEGTVSPAQLTFTSSNWNVVQNVVVTGVDDTDDDGDISFNLEASTSASTDASYAALANKTQAVTNTDNDAVITLPAAQTVCKTTGMSSVNAVITNVGAAISSVTAASNDQSIVDNSDITVTSLGGGTYGVEINNLGNNSLGTAQITLTANDGLLNYTGSFSVTTTGVSLVTNASSHAICQGESVTLSATGGQNISWNNGVTNNVSFIPTGTMAYTVTADNGSGCTGTAVETITVTPVPAVPTISGSGSLAICGSGSVTLTSSQASGNTWSNGSTAQSITVSAAGSYSVTYASGVCSVTSAPAVVTVNPVPSVPVITAGGPTTFCAGGSVTLTSSEASGNEWSDGSTTQSITVSAAGTYTLTVSNGTCSAASTPISVNVNAVPASPVITPSGATTFCSGGSVVLTSSQASGNNWSTGTATQSIIAATSNTYSVTYTDANGCISVPATVSITVNGLPAAPVITPSGATTFCEGSSVTLVSSQASGNNWSTGVSTQSINAVTSDTYSVTYTDVNGCVSPAASILVNVQALPTVSAGPDQTVCEGAMVTLLGSGAASYSWTGGITNGISFPVNAQSTFEVTGTGSNGCTNTDQVTIFVSSAPNVSAGPNIVVCSGQSVTLNGTGANTYDWDNGAVNGVPFVPVLGTTTYTVTGTNAAGCEAEDQMTVTVNQLPSVTISTIPTFCLSDGVAALTQGSPSGGTYAGTGITGTVFNPSTAGLGIHPVTYTYSDANGCQNTASGTITVDACLGLDETTAVKGSVYPNPTTGLANIEFPGLFTYSVTDAQGRTILDGKASESAQVDLSSFSDGVYQLLIQTETVSTIVRIVKN